MCIRGIKCNCVYICGDGGDDEGGDGSGDASDSVGIDIWFRESLFRRQQRWGTGDSVKMVVEVVTRMTREREACE